MSLQLGYVGDPLGGSVLILSLGKGFSYDYFVALVYV